MALACLLGVGQVAALLAAFRGVIPGLFSTDVGCRELVAVLLPAIIVLQPINNLAFVWDGVLFGAGGFRFLSIDGAVRTAGCGHHGHRPAGSGRCAQPARCVGGSDCSHGAACSIHLAGISFRLGPLCCAAPARTLAHDAAAAGTGMRPSTRWSPVWPATAPMQNALQHDPLSLLQAHDSPSHVRRDGIRPAEGVRPVQDSRSA